MEFYNNPHRTYKSEKGKREFRAVSIEKVPETEKFINRTEKHHWKVLIFFLDSKEPKKLKLTYDYNDKIIKKEKVNN